MRDIGVITKLRGKERSGTQKETFTVVTFETIWPMATVNILILMGLSTRENSEMTFKKDMEKRSG